MTKHSSFAILLLLGVIYGRCYGFCVESSGTKTGMCAYTLQCQGTIKDFDRALKCDQPNHRPVIHLELKDAIEHYNETLRPTHLLKSVINLTAVGNWEKASLSILKHTPALRLLYMSGIKIKHLVERPFFYLKKILILDISRNELTDVEHLFEFQMKTTKLRKLLLANNEMKKITKHSFEELHYLNELDLSNNSISDLSSGPFQNLIYLDTLKLNFNKIIQLSGSLNHLNYLRHLHLKGNQIRSIDNGLLHISLHLKTFDISLNDIYYIQSTLFLRNVYSPYSPQVFKVILSDNNIKALPDATESKSKFYASNILMPPKSNASIILDLSQNDIHEIAYSAFEGTYSIKSLDLSHNKIYSLLIRSEDLSGIERLNLSKNYLDHLNYESFSSMTQLEILDLSHNRIEFIRNGTFARNHRLRCVNMTNNQIVAVNGLQFRIFHADGGFLDFSRNSLTKFALKFGEAVRLRTLSLNSNNISDTREIKLHNQVDLRKLDMSNNNVQNLTENSLLLPSSLFFVDLSHNKINKTVPSVFLHLNNLKVLNLSNNELETLSFGTFRGLKHLKSLDLSYNKMKVLNSNLFNDLHSLRVLSVKYNKIERINEKYWIGQYVHKLTVYLDGSDLTCEWLNTAVYNYRSGWSKMKPTAMDSKLLASDSVQNIPCTPKDSKFGCQGQTLQTVLADERLLMISQKILEEIMYQNNLIKNTLFYILERDEYDYEYF